MTNILEQMKDAFDTFMQKTDKFIEKFIEEEDLFLTWEEFHKKHPSVDKWEWEQMQKELQEM